MSRTFRKKGYELENITDKDGTKVAGFYTMEVTKHGYEYNWRHGLSGFQKYYRKPTRQEHNKEYYRIHGETECSDSEFRQFVLGKATKKSRMTARKQLKLFMLDDEYEVILNRKEKFVKQWFE